MSTGSLALDLDWSAEGKKLHTKLHGNAESNIQQFRQLAAAYDAQNKGQHVDGYKTADDKVNDLQSRMQALFGDTANQYGVQQTSWEETAQRGGSDFTALV